MHRWYRYRPVNLIRSLLLLLALAVAAPASAGYVLTAPTPADGSVQAYYAKAATGCFGYTFDTLANAKQCLIDRSPAQSSGYVFSTYGSCNGCGPAFNNSGFYISVGTSCAAGNLVNLGPFKFEVFYGGSTVADDAGKISWRPIAIRVNYGSGTVIQYTQFSDSSCKTAKTWTNLSAAFLTVSYTTNAAAGGNSPPDPNRPVCRMPPSFIPGARPAKAYAVNAQGFFTPADLDAFSLQTGTTTLAVMRDMYPKLPLSDRTTFLDAAIYRVSFPQFGSDAICVMRRMARIAYGMQGTETVGIMYLDQVVNGLVVSIPYVSDVQATPQEEIVVNAPRKTKPLIPYGTPKRADGYIATKASVKALVAEELAKTDLSDSEAEGIEVTAAVDWRNRPTDYLHPSPEYLARDNPDCTKKFNPACAWKESPNPATSADDPTKLVRLSTDGQSIVSNADYASSNSPICPHICPQNWTTAYPPAMGIGSSGSASNPLTGAANSDTVDGQAVAGAQGDVDKFTRCYSSPEGSDCAEDYSSGELSTGAKGSVNGELGEVSGIGAGLVQKALAAGKCKQGETSTYCSLSVALARWTDRVSPIREFVFFDDTLNIFGTPVSFKIVIPIYVVSFIVLILQVAAYWAAFWILLTGRMNP